MPLKCPSIIVTGESNQIKASLVFLYLLSPILDSQKNHIATEVLHRRCYRSIQSNQRSIGVFVLVESNFEFTHESHRQSSAPPSLSLVNPIKSKLHCYFCTCLVQFWISKKITSPLKCLTIVVTGKSNEKRPVAYLFSVGCTLDVCTISHH